MSQAPHPRMHGLTHVLGGSDPVPFLPTGAGTYTERVLAEPSLLAYWPLSDTAVPCADVSGNNKPLTVATGSPTFLQPGPLPDSAYPYAVALNGTFGLSGVAESLRRFDDPADAADSYFSFGATDPFTIEMWVLAAGWPTTGFPTLAMLTLGGGTNFVALNSYGGDYAFAREVICKGVKTTGVTLNQGTWVHVAATFDGTVARIYFDADAIAAGTGNSSQTGASQRVEVGGLYLAGPGEQASWNGSVAHVAVYNQALTQGQLAAHLDGADVAASMEGLVLGLDENGNPAWVEPTVEVTGGGINVTPPDDTPVDSSSTFGGTPTTPSGWHLDAHFETVILHDSTRGRFDVPTMKWTRVPFNAIRISRTWEPTVGSSIVKTALLPDDRGLTAAARDGILHINADMVWASPQTVGGWFSIEYPVLEPGGLPDDDPEVPGDGPRPEAPRPGDPIAAPDTYMRAARMMNVSQGYVLRMAPGSDTRAIRGWGFQDTADGIGDSPHTDLVDNPFPTYPIWAARPLHMLPPYPQMSPTESRDYYVNFQGDPGFRFDDLQVHTDLAAGANLCLQAWQDSPWLIRFSTDRFPAYHGYTGTYRGYPYLAITFSYDPDTIDHTTGKLLLPAPA